jgi:SAM-dependent methyltransferase
MEYEVIGVDLRTDIPYTLERFHLLQGDFNQVPIEPASFDVIILCSTVEYIGLAGRYGNSGDPDGDIKAMAKVYRLLKPCGVSSLVKSYRLHFNRSLEKSYHPR